MGLRFNKIIGFEERVILRISSEDLDKAYKMQSVNQDKYESISQYIRVAIIQLNKREGVEYEKRQIEKKALKRKKDDEKVFRV